MHIMRATLAATTQPTKTSTDCDISTNGMGTEPSKENSCARSKDCRFIRGQVRGRRG